MIIDILQTIINCSNLKNQIECIQIDGHTYMNLYIYSLNTSKCHINQNILENRYFGRLKILNCSGNAQITNLNFFGDTLEILDISSNIDLYSDNTCGVDQNGIYQLKKVKSLVCSNNGKIVDVNHLTDTLEILDISFKDFHFYGGQYGVTQNGISQLKKVISLNCTNNERINDVGHLSETLEILHCNGHGSAINQNGIMKLRKIKVLHCEYNPNINNVNHLAETLEELYCHGYTCAISQFGISLCYKLKILDTGGNNNINNIDHIGNILEELYCDNMNTINQNTIYRLTRLKKLVCRNNDAIYDVNHLADTLVVGSPGLIKMAYLD